MSAEYLKLCPRAMCFDGSGYKEWRKEEMWTKGKKNVEITLLFFMKSICENFLPKVGAKPCLPSF